MYLVQHVFRTLRLDDDAKHLFKQWRNKRCNQPNLLWIQIIINNGLMLMMLILGHSFIGFLSRLAVQSSQLDQYALWLAQMDTDNGG